MVFSPLVPFPYPRASITNITPVTYRDAETFLEQLETIKKWLNDYVISAVNEGHAALIETLAEGIANAENTVLEAKAGWEAEFDAYMVDVNASLMALNDQAMSDLIELPTSETAKSLLLEFTKKSLARSVYVDPVNGLDTNGGGAVAPFKTVSHAIKQAEAVATVADAEYTINLVPGTYTERVTAAAYTPFALNIVIQGPEVGHPGVPTVLFSEGDGASAAAFKFTNPNAIMTVKYIKFFGYNGTSSSAGINSSQGVLNTVNVHAEKCFYGVSSTRGQIDVKGGVFHNNGRLLNGTGNGAAVRSLMLNRHSIGVQGAMSLLNGPVFTANRYGVYAQENSTGHVDYCSFTENESAIVLRVSCRANVDGSSFARNLTDIQADSNSHAFVPSSVVFGTGVDKSTQTVSLTSGSQATTTRDIEGTAAGYNRGEYAVFGTYTAQTVTGTTATVFVLDKNLLAPWWADAQRISGTAPKRVRVKAVGTLTGISGTTQLILKYGTKTSSITFSATEEGNFIYEGEILFPAPDRQIITSSAIRHLTETPRNNVSTTNQDTTTTQRLTLGVVLGSATDSVVFEYVELSAG